MRGRGAGSGLCSLVRLALSAAPKSTEDTEVKWLGLSVLFSGCEMGCSGSEVSVWVRKTVLGLGGVGEGVGAGVSGSLGASLCPSSSFDSDSSLDDSESVSVWQGGEGLGRAIGWWRSSSGQVSQQYWPRSVW